MRINYHILSSKISDRQTFREYIHGASRYTQLVNTSFIKIKNSIKTALKAILKPRINNVAFSNSKFLTTRIEEARGTSLEKGQAKYRAYFVRKSAAKLYGRYQDTVNSILELDGFSDCIVSE